MKKMSVVMMVVCLAIWHYDRSEDYPKTREATLAVLSAEMEKEKNKKAFANADGFYVEQSKKYAESLQRKAIGAHRQASRERSPLSTVHEGSGDTAVRVPFSEIYGVGYTDRRSFWSGGWYRDWSIGMRKVGLIGLKTRQPKHL